MNVQWPLVRTGIGDAGELPATLVRTPHTRRALDAGTQGPVTVLSAPAGWGKTMALRSWLCPEHAPDRPEGPVAWVGLEAGDDANRFWSRVDAAIAGAVGADPPPPSSSQGPSALAAWLRERDVPLRLVLDDFHVMTNQAVIAGIDVLVEHSGGGLRLVIATRTDPGLPLHRWRIRGDLTQLGPDDLAFTLAETTELLARHGIELPATEARTLFERTEGWPGGVQLAALAMRGRADAAQVAANFSGEDETVAQYLEAEVLTSLPPSQRDLLVCASIVDRVCGELADALTERHGAEVHLVDLRRANAFIVPVDGRPGWYRLHRLFGETLRARVRRRPVRFRHLHQRAATWHATRGLPMAALRHALAADDHDLASRVLRENWPDLALAGCHGPGIGPPPTPRPGVRPESDELTIAYVAERLDAHDVTAADRMLAGMADRTDSDAPLWTGPVAVAALRLARARVASSPDVAAAARALLDRSAGASAATGVDAATGDAAVQLASARTIAHFALGTAYLGLGDVQAAEQHLAEASAGGTDRMDCAARLSTGGLALVEAVRGDLRRAERLAHTALAWSACPGQSPCLHCEPAYLALALVYLERDRAEDAGRFLELARTSQELSGDDALRLWTIHIECRLRLALGELDEATAALLDGRRLLPGPNAPMAHWFAAAEAEVRIASGEARAVPAMLTAVVDDVDAVAAPVALALARAHLYEGDLHAAARALPPWSDEGPAEPYLALRLDAGLVEALAARGAGDARRAAATLERVLALAEPDGFRRVFVSGGQPVRELLAEQLEYDTAHWALVRELIEASEAPVSPDGAVSPDGPAEALTERERTILRYLQSVLSNDEIASKLFVSVNTVKTHVRNIYRKLHVARRRDAVRRARELHLL